MSKHDRAGNAYGSPAAAKTNAERSKATHGDEGKTRTDFHPLVGFSKGRTVGKYVGSVGTPGGARSHFFDARATGGGAGDSFSLNDTDHFKWNPGSGDMYTFDREQSHSGTIQPYDRSLHWGIPGAPMDDTPVKYHDRNYK